MGKRMKILTMVLIPACLALPSYATSANLIIGGWSYHPSKVYQDGSLAIQYNDNNKLIAIEANSFILASFKNSYYEQTKAFGYDFKISKHFGIMPLLTDTYDNETPLKLGPVNLMGMLTFKAGPVVLLFVPGEAYTFAFKLKL